MYRLGDVPLDRHANWAKGCFGDVRKYYIIEVPIYSKNVHVKDVKRIKEMSC